jgi:FkbM family methyltransferase
MNYLNFIEIGTSNFDTLISNAKLESGISIEPISYYLNQLPIKPNVLKMHCGISDKEELRTFFYIPEKIIQEKKLPSWLKGCNSIDKIHPTAINICNSYNLDINKIIESETVNTITLKKVLDIFNIKSIDFLKIDTEGHDCVVLSTILDDLINETLLIKKIKFETNQLSNKNDQKYILDKLSIFYEILTEGSNTILNKK